MRRIFGMVAVAVMLMAGGVASAQFVDPSTGIPVDPTTDPMDYVNAMSGQPTNIGMEAAAYATSQAQASAQAAMDAMNQTSSLFPAEDDNAPAEPAVPTTPKPLMTPNGGRFKGAVRVTLADKHAKAMVHYTVDGSKPTEGSPLYVAPLTVTAKTKVRAIAVGSGELDSGIVTKTFNVKS